MVKIKRVELKKPKPVRGTRMRQCYRCNIIFDSCSRKSKVVCDGCNLRLRNRKVYIEPNTHNIMVGGN